MKVFAVNKNASHSGAIARQFMSEFLHDNDKNDKTDTAKAIEIPRDFSENCRAKNETQIMKFV